MPKPPPTPSALPPPKGVTLALLPVAVIATAALVGGLVVGSALHMDSPAGSASPPRGSEKLAPLPASPASASLATTTAGASGARGSALAEFQQATRGLSEFSRYRSGLVATGRLTLAEIPQAMAFALTLGPEERRLYTMGALARWAELDPRGAVEWTRTQFHRQPELAPMLSAGVAEWAAQDATAARAWIETLKSPDDRTKALGGYFRAYGLKDPAAGLQGIALLSEKDQPKARESLYRAWATRDPQAALAQAQLAEGETRANLVKTILPVWAQAQPQEALAAAQALDHQAGNAGLTTTLMINWASRDPAAALAQLVTMPEALRESLATGVFSTAAQLDPEVARSFAAQLPSGRMADQAQAAIICAEAQQEPARAAAALASLPDGPEQQKAVESISYSWSRTEPEVAARWLLTTSEGSGRVNAARSLVFTWGARDPQAAGQWISQLPPGPTYDAAAGAFAWRAANSDAPTAIEWAASMSDAQSREQTTQMVLEGWIKRDPASAKAWLQTSSLISGDLREYLLRQR